MFIAAYITTVVLLVAAWLWCAIAASDARKRADALSDTIVALHKKMGESYSEGYQKGVVTSSGILQTTVVTTVGDIAKLLMNETIGTPGAENVTRPVTDQTPEPSWFDWEETGKTLEEIGIGDSVFVDREFDHRVAAIGDGESIIPGVPLPDMTGENVE